MFKRAFTMIELIFVIVVIGIISKFGIEILLNSYENYVISATQSRLQSQSESALTQIAARLQYRIKESTIARDAAGTYRSVQGALGTETILEWIGSDIEGWRGSTVGATTPNWSGFIDWNASNPNMLKTLRTNTATTSALIKVLSNNAVDINASAIHFIGANSNALTEYGWDGIAFGGDQNHSMHEIGINLNPDEFLPSGAINFAGVDVWEYYQLSWSAYAIVHANNQLRLYYNYRPWLGETYLQGSNQLLMEDVDTFGFLSIDTMIKIQICVTDSNTFNEGAYSICKEKTIF